MILFTTHQLTGSAMLTAKDRTAADLGLNPSQVLLDLDDDGAPVLTVDPSLDVDGEIALAAFKAHLNDLWNQWGGYMEEMKAKADAFPAPVIPEDEFPDQLRAWMGLWDA